jgi:hypothetical protein
VDRKVFSLFCEISFGTSGLELNEFNQHEWRGRREFNTMKALPLHACSICLLVYLT